MAAGTRSLFFLTVLLTGLTLTAQDSGVSAVMSDFALPEYRKGNQLEFILYGKKAVNAGVFVDLADPVLDVMRNKQCDITQIVPLLGLEPYPLNTPFQEILTFWEEHAASRYIITSAKAVYEKNQRTIRSDSKVFFRSREMDVDGIGYDADLKRQHLHIRSSVKIHLRLGMPKKNKKDAEEKKNK